jgi:hypothetical protein
MSSAAIRRVASVGVPTAFALMFGLSLPSASALSTQPDPRIVAPCEEASGIVGCGLFNRFLSWTKTFPIPPPPPPPIVLVPVFTG